MSYDFRKSLKSNKKREIPQSIINELNKNLPAGYAYQRLSDKLLELVPDSDNKNVQFNISMKKLHLENLPKDVSFKNFEEVLDYATEHNLELKGKFDGPISVTIGSKKIPTAGMVCAPLKNEQVTAGEFVIKPNIKKLNWKITVERYSYNITVLVRRTRSKCYIASERDTPLNIEVVIDIANLTVKVNVEVNMQGKNSIAELLEVLHIQYGLLSGTACINDKECFWKQAKRMTGNFEELSDRIQWWKAIETLEGKLNSKFVINFPIPNELRLFLQALYISLIFNKPYKEYIDMESFTAKFNQKYTPKKMEKLPPLILKDQLALNTLGIPRKIFRLQKIYNLIVKDYEMQDNGSIKVNLQHEVNNNVYRVTKMFLSEDELTKYLKENAEEMEKATLFSEIKIV